MNKIEKNHNFRVAERLVDSTKIIFLFTAMGTSLRLYTPVVKRLNKAGYSVVVYDYPARLVLKADFAAYEPLYEAIELDVRARIQRYQPRFVYAYGVSMGTIFAHRLTCNISEITHVIMNMTYGDIAENVMHSPANRKTRKSMQRKGLSYQDLREAVKEYDPIRNAHGLRDKKVWLHLSVRDKVLDYRITFKTKEALESHVKEFTYTKDQKHGHYIAGVKHLMSTEQIDIFYRS